MNLNHIYRTLKAPSYRHTLWKAIKGERRIDNDFFAWNFDTNMVEALRVHLKRKKVEHDIDFEVDEIIKACDEFLKKRYKRSKNASISVLDNSKIIWEFLAEKLPRLWL